MDGQITKDKMKYEFDLLAEKFQHGSADQKLLGLAEMLRLTSRYLRQEIDRIDSTAIIITLEELTNISETGSAKFIKPLENTVGHPKLTAENFQLASVAAAVEALKSDGMKVKDATSFVAERTGLTTSRVAQIRKEFREGKRQTKATEFMWKQIRESQVSKTSAEDIALNLITMSLIKGG